MKSLFQYVVIFHKMEDDEYVDSEIVIEPKYILANTEKEVLFKATREIPEQYAVDPENVQILVRNF